MQVLITGGAGYIGSTVASALADAGDVPILVDDLSCGRPAFLRDFPTYIGDFADPDLLDRVFRDHRPELVIHCAGRTVVPHSLADPAGYYLTNVAATMRLVGQLIERGCPRLVWSSSAAVYGAAAEPVITEETPPRPLTPYAAGKLMIEQFLADVCASGSISALSLRYFNPIGADPWFRTGPYKVDDGGVVSRLLAAAAADEPFTINGCDWPTPDGTPMRDFVHVWDVASAHVSAVHRWPLSGGGHLVLNIGSGHGTTVRHLAETFNRLAPRPVQIAVGERRVGDIAGGYASTDKAARLLGYAPSRAVCDGLRDALTWAGQIRASGRPGLG